MLFLTLGSAPAVGAQPDRAAATAAELEQLRVRIENLRATMDQDLSRRDQARAALRSLERTVASHADTLRGIEAALRDGQRRLGRLQSDRASREAELGRERDALAGQLRAAYATGRQERLRMLLNQEDPAAVGRVLVYYDYLNRARVTRIERIDTLLDELDELSEDIVAESAALELRRGQQAAALARLERTRSEREQVLAAIEREVRARGQELSRLQADEETLQRLLESLTDLLADVPADLGDRQAFGTQRGRLGWPAQGRVIARFGQTREGASRWRGLLIAADAGAEVRAVAYGRVAWAGWMPHFGNLLVIDHGDGFYTLYGHTRTMLRDIGEWVSAGEVIAEVGDSGGQSQPALYFELRQGRQPVNPQQWLVSR